MDAAHFHLYFEIDDVDGTAAALRANSVRLLRDVHDTPWGAREFVINDDQGHTLYFGAPRSPAAQPNHEETLQ